MAKVFGIHIIELKPGIAEEEFIRFINDQYGKLGARMGWKASVAKGDRGERAGKLAVVWEIPSVEQRDRYMPEGGLSEEGTRVLEPDFSRQNETWDRLVASAEMTDYIVQD